jgi:hypothetical protein
MSSKVAAALLSAEPSIPFSILLRVAIVFNMKVYIRNVLTVWCPLVLTKIMLEVIFGKVKFFSEVRIGFSAPHIHTNLWFP